MSQAFLRLLASKLGQDGGRRARRSAALGACLCAAAAAACGGSAPRAEAAPTISATSDLPLGTVDSRRPTKPSSGEADLFVRAVNDDLRQLWTHSERTNWVKATYITHDTELLAAEAQERVMEYLSRRIKEARRFEGLSLEPDTARSLYHLRYSAGLPAPMNNGRGAASAINWCESTGRSAGVSGPAYLM